MRLHLIEHDPDDLSRTNITLWAEKKGYQIRHTYLCNNEKLPAIEDFDWLMVMGGSPHTWEADIHPWLPPEKEFIARALDHDKIILGICFGAQLLAEALGGKVFTSQNKEIGWHEVILTPQGQISFLFQNIPKQFMTFHWHADHFAGLPGLIQSLSLKDRTEPLYIYGPKDTEKYIDQILKLGHVGQKYKVVAKTVKPGKVFESDKYTVFALKTSHDVPTLAFKFREADKPGRFDVKKAKSLGLREVQFGELQRGKSVRKKHLSR